MVILLMMLSFGVSVSAQEKETKEKPTPEQMLEARALRLSSKLMLDEKTSVKFVALYKEYVNALVKCRADFDKTKCEKGVTPTDAQRLERMKQRFAMQSKVADIKGDYVTKFSKILTAKQVQMVMSKAPGNGNGKKAWGQKGNGKKAWGKRGAGMKGMGMRGYGMCKGAAQGKCQNAENCPSRK